METEKGAAGNTDGNRAECEKKSRHASWACRRMRAMPRRGRYLVFARVVSAETIPGSRAARTADARTLRRNSVFGEVRVGWSGNRGGSTLSPGVWAMGHRSEHIRACRIGGYIAKGTVYGYRQRGYRNTLGMGKVFKEVSQNPQFGKRHGVISTRKIAHHRLAPDAIGQGNLPDSHPALLAKLEAVIARHGMRSAHSLRPITCRPVRLDGLHVPVNIARQSVHDSASRRCGVP